MDNVKEIYEFRSFASGIDGTLMKKLTALYQQFASKKIIKDIRGRISKYEVLKKMPLKNQMLLK